METTYFEQAEQAKLSVINKTVTLATHPEIDNWGRKVKIIDANYKTGLVEIDLFGKSETVKFSQLKAIKIITENHVKTVKERIQAKIKQWANPHDKTSIREGSKCSWLYRAYSDFLTEKEWEAVAYNFNANSPDFSKFSSDVVEMLAMKVN